MLPGPPTYLQSHEGNDQASHGHRGPDFKEVLHKRSTRRRKCFRPRKTLFILTTSGTGATECALQNIIDDGDKIIVNVNGFFSERLAEAIKAYGGHP